MQIKGRPHTRSAFSLFMIYRRCLRYSHRVNHMLFDDGISTVSTHKRDQRKNDKCGNCDQEPEIVLQAHKCNYCPECHQNNGAKRSHKVSLDTERREDQGILEHLVDGNVERDHHQIHVHSHEQIKNDQCRDDKEHQIRPVAGARAPHVHEVYGEHDDNGGVDQTVNQTLLEVFLDCYI